MTKAFIIAEAGVNHNGSIELAKKLVDKAIHAGCDAVKFQTFKAENVVSKVAEKAEYQKKNTDSKESQLEMIKKLELSFDDFAELKRYCDNCGIIFLSSPFDIESVDFLANLGVKYFKIPSGEIVNLPLLRRINFCRKRVILSTGMATIEEIDAAMKALSSCEISLLHCTTEYPCPYDEVNLKAIQTLKNRFNLTVGYSDHTEGIEIPVAAVTMGATIVEKHFTLDKNMDGPDHKASLEPHELRQMVSAIRNVEKAMGNGEKIPSKSELKNISIVRKSIVAKRDIKKGEIFSEENLTTKRSGNGISPMQWDEIIGTFALKDYLEDELI
ncbi:MAG: N-acetylneuraminate synthase [Holosporaceae bacterium]|jgi:N,N'-diacetyllegionaminate synthase|nr:N-acetylneuraminate synthase [Holosporaceae bacterium]